MIHIIHEAMSAEEITDPPAGFICLVSNVENVQNVEKNLEKFRCLKALLSPSTTHHTPHYPFPVLLSSKGPNIAQLWRKLTAH